jgi:DNA/RNA endonuclease YhcR with UshA esterase domain
MQNTIRTLAALIVGLMVVGCGSRPGPVTTDEPVSLPPTRPPATPTQAIPATPSPAPTATLPAPTATQTPTPRPTASPAPTPVPQASPTPNQTEEAQEITPIGALDAAMIGQEVTVEGNVVSTESFSGGFKFTLDDGSGQTVLLMWHNVYDDCWDAPGINLGARVRATGEVTEYEGELQVQPAWGSAVQAVEPATAWGSLRQVGSLSGADEGQRVTIEGQVVRVEGLSSAVKVFVSDGTGEVNVFIWRNVLDRIDSNAGLGTPGSRVRVTGSVAIYRSNLEVVPTLPSDVMVLEIP